MHTLGEPEKKPTALPPTGNVSPFKNNWRNRKKRHDKRPIVQTATFLGGKDELDRNYFDCTGYRHSDRFVKTVQNIAGYIGQEYQCSGLTCTEVMTQSPVLIPAANRPAGINVMAINATVTYTPPDVLDISNYQSEKKASDYKLLH